MRKRYGFFTIILLLLLVGSTSFADVQQIELTKEEKAWVKQHPIINIRISRSYPPYEYYEDGRYQGIAFDYLHLISNRLGLTFKPVENLTWTEALESIKTRSGVDMILVITQTPERQDSLNFTKDYLSYPEVIFTRKNGVFISDINDLSGATVAVEKDFIQAEQLELDYKDIKLIHVDSTGEALKDVALGNADAYIGNLAVGSSLITKLGLANLKVAAIAPYGHDNYAMAVRKDWPMLATILDKGLDSLIREDHNKIRNKWLTIRYEHGLRVVDIFLWVGGALFIASIFIFQLRRMVKIRTRELQNMHDKLEMLVNERTAELKQVQDKLLVQERLAILGKLTATVSHELRNPLGTINNSLYNIRQAIKNNKSDMIASTLGVAERNIHRCAEIIDELLDYGRKQHLIRKAVSIDELLIEITTEFPWKEGIKVVTNFNSGAVVLVDTERLRRAIINLLTNAQQALPEPHLSGKRIILSTVKQATEINITIEDNGPGIPEDLREKIYEPLFSTKNFGVGLGMAIVKDIMGMHKGGIRHEVPENGGCRFVLWLPCD